LDEDALPTFRKAFIQAVTPFFAELMMDQFGNYLSQKVLEVSTSQDIKAVIGTILPSISDISMNIHGTRAIQFLVQMLHKQLP
jgi:Pumilio-family RNA binding repeat